MEPDREGFLFPCVDEAKCKACRSCEQVCERLNKVSLNPRAKGVLAAWALDQKIRNDSSSGGVFSVLATSVLKDGGVVNGVVFDRRFNLRHRLARNLVDLSGLRGSRYVQSVAEDVYKKVEQELRSGHRVFFTATPCQVSGLKAYLGKEYDNLVTCDFICHGVPSPGYFRQYVKNRIEECGRVDAVDYVFRDLKGWNYRCALRFSNGEEVCYSPYSDAYMGPFLAGASQRECCYNCKYATEQRCADITLGDFWSIKYYLPRPTYGEGGVSLVLINSDKGRRLLDEARNELYCRTYPWLACYDNGQLHRPTPRPLVRDVFYSFATQTPPAQLLAKCGLSKEGRTFRRIVKVAWRKGCQVFNRSIIRIYVKLWEIFQR